MKTICIKLFALFFVFISIFSCGENEVLPGEKLVIKSYKSSIASYESVLAASPFLYTLPYVDGGGIETMADAGHSQVITGIGASVSAGRNVDRIVLLTRTINVEDGSLGTELPFGYGPVGENDPRFEQCEAKIRVPNGHVITEVKVASSG